jgi:hypothetical protein
LDLRYDTNGNLKQRGSQTYTFDIGNRLKSATGKASYAYDGLGRRSWVNVTCLPATLSPSFSRVTASPALGPELCLGQGLARHGSTGGPQMLCNLSRSVSFSQPCAS